MCGAHPAFEGAAIWATPDSCKIITHSTMPPQFYLFSSDFPADKCAALSEQNNIPTIASAFAEIDSPSMVALLAAVRAPLAAQYTSVPHTTFEQLYADQPITIDNACFHETRVLPVQAASLSLGFYQFRLPLCPVSP